MDLDRARQAHIRRSGALAGRLATGSSLSRVATSVLLLETR
jgi:hypothetical protein